MFPFFLVIIDVVMIYTDFPTVLYKISAKKVGKKEMPFGRVIQIRRESIYVETNSKTRQTKIS